MTTHALTQLSNTTATRLTPNGIHSGMDITIQNVNTEGYIYVGGEGVNQENFGYRISPNNGWSIELPGADALYAISDTDGAYVAILKTNIELGS
jgi:hypothetical protein